MFSYLGKASPVWRNGQWVKTWGWMDLKRVQLDIGTRWAAACEVPDQMLFYKAHSGIQTVRFRAALEFPMQQVALWVLAALRRVGLPLPVHRWAAGLNRCAGLFDAFAGDRGGMSVTVVGQDQAEVRIRRTWQRAVPARDGPEIPCMAAILLARRIAHSILVKPMAQPCVGLLTLADFEPEFARWGITTRIEEGEV